MGWDAVNRADDGLRTTSLPIFDKVSEGAAPIFADPGHHGLGLPADKVHSLTLVSGLRYEQTAYKILRGNAIKMPELDRV